MVAARCSETSRSRAYHGLNGIPVGWALTVEALVIVRLGPFTPAGVCVFRALVLQAGLVVRERCQRPSCFLMATKNGLAIVGRSPALSGVKPIILSRRSFE